MIDIHGFSQEFDSDIDIGTNNGLNINEREDFLETIIGELKEIEELRIITIDKKYKASFSTNISRYISEKIKVLDVFKWKLVIN